MNFRVVLMAHFKAEDFLLVHQEEDSFARLTNVDQIKDL